MYGPTISGLWLRQNFDQLPNCYPAIRLPASLSAEVWTWIVFIIDFRLVTTLVTIRRRSYLVLMLSIIALTGKFGIYILYCFDKSVHVSNFRRPRDARGW